MRQIWPKARFSDSFRALYPKSHKYTVFSLFSKRSVNQTFIAQILWKILTPSLVWTYLVPALETNKKTTAFSCSVWIIQVVFLVTPRWNCHNCKGQTNSLYGPVMATCFNLAPSLHSDKNHSCSETCKLMFRNLPFILTVAAILLNRFSEKKL